MTEEKKQVEKINGHNDHDLSAYGPYDACCTIDKSSISRETAAGKTGSGKWIIRNRSIRN